MQTVELQLLKEALADRYRFDREIGRGGWGVVYRADDLRHQRRVAIKVIIATEGSLSSRDRFRREVVLEANLVHPHVVPIFDSGEVGDAMYFVMPFIDGESLFERLGRDGRLPIVDALRYARHVAEALSHAHANNIIHRDIKPANILLASGNALLADFGIAKAFDQPSDWGLFKTLESLPIGTLVYMAPEQATGGAVLDGRADLYSLGCVLYEMLAGRPPYYSPAPGELLAMHAGGTLPALRGIRPEVSPALEALVARLLAKVPADRVPSADALVAAIDEIAMAEAGSGPHWRVAGRRRMVAALAAIGAVTIAGAATADRWWPGTAGIGAADTTLIVLFPLEGDAAVAEEVTATLRRAIARWRGVALVDAFLVRDAAGDAPLTQTRSARITRGLNAGRFVRGSVMRTEGGLEVHAVLSGTGRDEGMVIETNERLPLGEGPRDSALVRIADRLLVRRSLPADLASASVGTTSLPALQHYLRGRDEVLRWALDSAERSFESAWQADEGFAVAARWLATTRYWLRRDPSTWRLFALVAARDSGPSDPRQLEHSRALVAFADRDLGTACDTWDGLTRRAPLDFAVWYDAALCHDSDFRIVPDRSSPSGWRFRSSYQGTIAQYLRALQLLPNAHRALRDDGFERVRLLLGLGSTSLRRGVSADGAEVQFAYPSTFDDTLARIPYPAAEVFRAEGAVADAHVEGLRSAVRRQRSLFRDVTSMWVSADGGSAEAQEAHALALQLHGDDAALDAIDRAVALAADPAQRLRVAGTEAWIRLRFSLPDDKRTLRRVRVLSDSVLRFSRGDQDLKMRLSLAALTGRISVAQGLLGRLARASGSALPDTALRLARTLELAAAFGAPPDSLGILGTALDSVLRASVDLAELSTVRREAFTRAARLAWVGVPLPIELMTASPNDMLLPTLIADLRGDENVVRRGLAGLHTLRRTWTPRTVSFDALLVEASLIAKYEGAEAAVAWLEEPLRVQRESAPEFDPINAVAFVRTLGLRATLAAALGDSVSARRWASAVVELWADADRPLRPFVQQMQLLARD